MDRGNIVLQSLRLEALAGENTGKFLEVTGAGCGFGFFNALDLLIFVVERKKARQFVPSLTVNCRVDYFSALFELGAFDIDFKKGANPEKAVF